MRRFPLTALAVLTLAIAGCGDDSDSSKDAVPSQSDTPTVETTSDLQLSPPVTQQAEDEYSRSGRVAICAATARAYRCMTIADDRVVDEPRGVVSSGVLVPAARAADRDLVDASIAETWADLAIELCRDQDVAVNVRTARSNSGTCSTVGQ